MNARSQPPASATPDSSDQPEVATNLSPAAQRRADMTHHATFLVLALLALVLSFVMRIEEGRYVFLPFFDSPLPDVCTFKRMFGIGCPGCGLTRSFLCIAQGEFVAGWNYNVVAPLMFATMLLQLVYRPWQIARLWRGLPEQRLGRYATWWIVFLSILLFLQWIVRLGMGSTPT